MSASAWIILSEPPCIRKHRKLVALSIGGKFSASVCRVTRKVLSFCHEGLGSLDCIGFRLRLTSQFRHPSRDRNALSSLECRLIILLTLVRVLSCLIRLGQPGFLNPGEDRYAEAVRVMGRSGDWAVPRVNGQVPLGKPPLLYWLAAGSFSLLGANETSARPISVLSSLMTGFIVFLLVRGLYGPKADWLSAFSLLTGMTWSVGFWQSSWSVMIASV